MNLRIKLVRKLPGHGGDVRQYRSSERASALYCGCVIVKLLRRCSLVSKPSRGVSPRRPAALQRRSLDARWHTPRAEIVRLRGVPSTVMRGKPGQFEHRPAEAEPHSLRTRLVHRPRGAVSPPRRNSGPDRHPVAANLQNARPVPAARMRQLLCQ